MNYRCLIIPLATCLAAGCRPNHPDINREAWDSLGTRITNKDGSVFTCFTNEPTALMESKTGIVPGVSDEPRLPVGSYWVDVTYCKSESLTVPHYIGIAKIIGVRSNFVETLTWSFFPEPENSQWRTWPGPAHIYFTDKSLILDKKDTVRIEPYVFP